MKFARHETFHFREGWLTKGMRKVESEQQQDVFLRKDALEELGIGTNMVKSLRYWMQAMKLTWEPSHGKKLQNLTEFGKLVYAYDRYLEEELTLWLLHYHLVTNKESATTWYWFFNVCSQKEFDKEIFVTELESYVKEAGEDVSTRSLEKDFDCLLSTYLNDNDLGNLNPENNLRCPLQELGLIEVADKKLKRYRITRRNVRNMPLELFWFAIRHFMGERTDVSIDELLTSEMSIGRVFNLGLSDLVQVLELLQVEGYLHLSKTAGLNYVSLRKTEDALKIIENYYRAKIGVSA